MASKKPVDWKRVMAAAVARIRKPGCTWRDQYRAEYVIAMYDDALSREKSNKARKGGGEKA